MKDGGPAFPTPAHNLVNDGMTLRDYFAAKALAALIAEPPWDGGRATHWTQSEAAGYRGNDGAASMAIAAYHMADAMLKAREQ